MLELRHLGWILSTFMRVFRDIQGEFRCGATPRHTLQVWVLYRYIYTDFFTRTLTPRLPSRASRVARVRRSSCGSGRSHDSSPEWSSPKPLSPSAVWQLGGSAFVAQSTYYSAGRSWPHHLNLWSELKWEIFCSSAFCKIFMSNYIIFCEWF